MSDDSLEDGDDPTPLESLGCLLIAGFAGALLGLVGDVIGLVAAIRRWWA